MKTKTRFQKLTAWLLTLAMLMTFIPTFSQIGTGLTVYATEGTGSDSDDSELGGGTGDGGSEAGSGGSFGTEGDGTAVSYLAPVYEDGKIKFDENNDVVFETKTVTDYIVAEDIAYGDTITSADQMPTIGTSDETTWYVADSDVKWENFVLVQGDVHLIICDDVTITSSYGIVVSDGNSFTVYGQENGTGELIAKGMKYSGDFYSAAIGGCDVTTEMANGGTITINGCQITATASSNAAAIGGGNGGHGGNIIINGGTVSATATAYSAAIGGGSRGNSGNITINGGIVSAETSGSSSAIGAGYVMYSSTGGSILAKTDKIEINGGTVVASQTDSYEEYPVIGGLYGFDNINISGGHITVNHARSGGIGIGTNSVTVMEFDGNLNISGGTIISGNDKTLYLGAGKTSSSAKETVAVVVTGGNISGTFKNVSTLTDGTNNVVKKEFALVGAENKTPVTEIEGYEEYGLTDVVTDYDKLTIYVAENGAPEAIKTDEKTYLEAADGVYGVEGEKILSFNANGGTGAMSSISFLGSENKTLSLNEFTRSYYNFTGWNTSPDGNGTSYADGASINITENTVLYAQWEQITYNVTFDSGDGTGTMENDTAYAAASNNYILPECTFTAPEGKLFRGWKVGTSSTILIPGTKITVSSDTTATAVWGEPVVEVTVDGVTTKYPSLEQVIPVVKDKNAEIKVINDFSLTATTSIYATKLVLDLNNHTLNGNSRTFNLYCDVEVKGPGNIQFTSRPFYVRDNFRMTIGESVIITRTSGTSATSYAVQASNGSTLILNGGSVTCNSTTAIYSTGTAVVVNADGVASTFSAPNVYYNITPTTVPTNNNTSGKIWYRIDNQITNGNVIIADGITTVYDEKIYGLAGQTVTITPKAGYTLADVKVNGNDATESSGNYTFSMPAGVATLIGTASSSHTHNWNYELVGTDTIKATCQTANCPETGAKTIVISASSKVYDGTAVTATVVNNFDSTDYSASIVYEAKTGSLTDGKAVNVGTYTAKITVGGVTASVEFEITPVIYNVTLTDDGNGTASASHASGAEGTEVTLTANPKEGYKFKEWQVMPDTVTVENNRFTMPAGNVTVTAIFEAIPPTITAVYKSGMTHYIEWTASVSAGSGRTLTSVTVNGYELLDEENATTKNASVEIRYGGKYTFAVTDSTGNTASVELDIDIPVTFPADSITVVDNWSADKLYHRGEAIIDSSKLSGGAYDPSKITADGGAALAPKDYTGGYGYFQMVVNGVPEDFNIETEIIPWFEDIMWRDVTESSVGALKTANHIIVLQSLFDELNPDLIAWQFITVRDNKIKIESMSNSDMLNNQPGSITATFTGGHTGRYEVAILSGDGLTADAFKDSAVVWQPVQNGTITLDGLNDGTYRIAVRAKYEEADAYGSVNSNYWHGLVISEPVVIRSVYPITLEAVPAAGGSITASVESAENNEEFDVTITVEDEYAIQGLYYVDDDGGEVAFATSDYSSIQTAGTHTIRMPKRGATTIRVKFAPKVIFKDWDDTILSEQYVSYGSAATAPQNPARENWKFIGWDKAFDNVTEPLTVMARYEEKIVVSVPDIASKVYNGSAQTATVPESQYYTVKANNGGINAGEYDVVLELTDSEGYRWNTTNEKTVSMKFNITKAQAVITVDDTPIVKTYGEALTLPTATTNFGTVSADKTVADMKNAGEYTVTYTVAGNDNYNGDTKTVSVTINPKKIDKPSADNTSFVYDGNEHTYNVATSDYYTITGNKMTNAGSQTVTVALKDKVNYTWNDGKTDDVIFTFTIAKKDITGATVGNFEEITYTGGVQTPFATVTIDGLTVTGTWSNVTNVADKTTFIANGNFTGTIADKETGMLKANPTYTEPTAKTGLVYNGSAQELLNSGTAEGGTMKYYIGGTQASETVTTGTSAGEYTVNCIIAGDENHNNIVVGEYTVTIAKKSIEDATVALDGTLTYTGAEQTQNITVTLDGFTVTYDVTDNKATNVKADGNYTLKVTANGNFEGEKTLEWNIAKADHIIEGENIPIASRIRRGNKLSDSTITPAELKDADENVLGTFTWVTPDDEMTETGDFVKQVKFTPADATNYNEKTFDVTVNVYRPSSGGGGSSSNTTTTTTKNEDGSTTKVTENKTTGTKTEVTTNTDGSTTTVETKKDGTVTTTEKDNEGNTTTTVENPDGTSTTTEKNKDGSEKVTEEKADGTTVTTEKDTDGTKTVTTENTDGSKITEEVRKDGTEVKTETTTDGETTAEVKADGKAEVTIPVPDTEKVQMVVVTDENGNNTYITEVETNDNGVAVTTDGNATVSVMSGNKKEFVDVHHVDHWSEKSVDFVYILGLMNGTSENHFSPDVHLTRAMLVTVLYRAEGEPEIINDKSFTDVENGSYYEKAVAWAKANGIVNGTSATTFEPNVSITREQIAAIMHRYADFKGHDVQVGENTNILSYDDVHHVSEYAIGAMQYAVGSGLIKGKTESTLNPLDNATRAEAAAILERFIKAN